jgi:glutamyl-tRNA reductase
MPIVVLGLSHHTSPVTVRERFAFADTCVPAALQALRHSGIADEAVILSTCNRVELYAATRLDNSVAVDKLRAFLTSWHRYQEPLTEEIYALTEPESLEHLFRVACGLDSLVLGETEILGQLKRAYDLALQEGYTGSRLNKAFQRAFNVAKHIRTKTHIQRGSVSVGSVAVELAEKIFSSLAERDVLIIGAGDTSEKTARALLSRGARRLLVSNRTPERAVALADALGGAAIPFESWPSEFARIDIAITSTSAPHYLLDRAGLEPRMKLRRNRPLLLIDIAVPRNINPDVNFVEGVYLFNIDDLKLIADGYLKQRQEEVALCQGIIREKVQSLIATASWPSFGTGSGQQSDGNSTAAMRTGLDLSRLTRSARGAGRFGAGSEAAAGPESLKS